MPARKRYEITYSPDAVLHMRAIARKYRRLIRGVVEDQLGHSPNLPTRNRKPVVGETVYDATLELWLGPDNCFRVLYEIDESR